MPGQAKPGPATPSRAEPRHAAPRLAMLFRLLAPMRKWHRDFTGVPAYGSGVHVSRQNFSFAGSQQKSKPGGY